MKTKRLLILALVLSVLLSVGLVNLAGSTGYNTCIDLEKTGPETASPGETVSYHFWVKNCGEWVLSGGAQVYDSLFDPLQIWSGTIQPGVIVEFDKTYMLPEDHCGKFANHAWAIGHPLGPTGYLEDVRDDDQYDIDVICEPPPCQTDLIAGKDWDSPAGVVTVSDDGNSLSVTFEATGGWSLGETHLYVGTTPPGKSSPGQFPYGGQTEYAIPLSDLGVACGDDLYIAAHAVVTMGERQETAWADTYGTLIRDKGWAMYFGYTACSVNPDTGGCFKPERP